MKTNIANTIKITNYLEKPVMEEVKLCKSFRNLPEAEKEWFYEYQSQYTGKNKGENLTHYLFYKAARLFVEEYNEQLKERAKRKYKIAVMEYEKQMKLKATLGFHAVKIREMSEHKAHCDNEVYKCFFSRSITQQEFILFLEEMGKSILPRLNWYNDYTIIEGNENEWTYTRVEPWVNHIEEKCG